MKVIMVSSLIGAALLFPPAPPSSFALSDAYKDNVYETGNLKPTDSVLKVKAGDEAPDFKLPSVSGEWVSLGQFRGKKNVVISFVPAAWTPICSDQWPGYNIVKEMFEANDAILLGITVDNIPTLFSWTKQMGESLVSRPVRFLAARCGRETIRRAALRRHGGTGPVRDRQAGKDPLYRCP